MRLSRIVVLAGIVSAAAFSQTADVDIDKVVRGIVAKAKASPSYEFAGELTLLGQRGDSPGRVLSQAKVRLAVAPGGKSLLRLEPAQGGEYLLISNGEKNWAFVPSLKQYTEEAGAAITERSDEDSEEGASDNERDLSETFARTVMEVLTGLDRDIQAADVNGEEEVRYERKKQRWPVIRLMTRKGRDGQTLTTLAVDPATLRLGKLTSATVSNDNGVRTVVRLEMMFEYLRFEDVPPSTFEFEPPKKAKLVDAVPIPGQTGSFLLNKPAPDFELKNLDGAKVRLSDFRGRPVLLVFWASWCPPCRRELPDVVKVHKEYGPKGLIVFGLNDEDRDIARKFADAAELSFQTLDDYSHKAHRLFRVRSIPTSFLIDREGKIVRFFRGQREAEDLRKALAAVGL